MQDPATPKAEYEETNDPATQPLPDCGDEGMSPTREAEAANQGQGPEQGELPGEDEFKPEVPMADPPGPEGGSGGG